MTRHPGFSLFILYYNEYFIKNGNKPGFVNASEKLVSLATQKAQELNIKSEDGTFYNVCCPILKNEDLFGKGDKDGKIAADRLSSCFLCEKINWGMERMIETIYITYENDKDFREMFDGQPTFCLPHYSLLLSGIKKSRLKKYSSEFRSSLKKITQNQLSELNSDLLHFCSMFDYRNRGGDWGNSKTAIERTLSFRNGYEQEKNI